MDESFYLFSDTAKRLFREVKDLPIVDYHCHLSIDEIAEDRPVENLTQLWLYYDHYKWRLMRIAGVDEAYVTGAAPDREKFDAYLGALTYAAGSPLYAWSRLELKRYFDYDGELSIKNADEIWDLSLRAIKERGYTPKTLIERSNVEAVDIVEDVGRDLSRYGKVKAGFQIRPILRCDGLLGLPEREAVARFCERLPAFLAAGARSIDIGITGLDEGDGEKQRILRRILERAYAEDLAVQMHFSPRRNNNGPMFRKLGPDKGFDSISCAPYLDGLNALLGSLDKVGRTVLFNLDPADNAALASLCGNFAGDGIPGKVQLGAAWWFSDSAGGIERQLETTCEMSLLSVFVGMLTDSRSLISYPRHEYFRRILCNYLARLAERGEFTSDFTVLKKIARDVSYYNVKRFLKD